MNRNDREYESRRRPVQSGRSGGEPPRHERHQPKRRKSEYRVFRALGITVLLVALCVFMAYFALQSAGDLLGLDINVFGLRQEDKQVTVTIPEGSGVSEIADALKKAEVIDTQLAFRLYSRLKKMDDSYKAGEYMLNCKMSYDQIMTALSTGSKERQDVVQILFQEGLTLRDMGRKLEEENVCTADEFVEAMEDASYDYKFMKEIPTDRPLRFLLLEGYAFPDTYMFFVGEKAPSVARKFLSNFESKITDEMYARMDTLGMSLDEVVTLASIIQKEASYGTSAELKENMAAVSAVFHNRMKPDSEVPLLQSDVTIFYVRDNIKPFLTTQNEAMYDAYDTYVCKGLPVGPICNPGLEAIEAALYPDEHDYYYFITDKAGKFYYANTFDEHKANIREADKVNAEIKANAG